MWEGLGASKQSLIVQGAQDFSKKFPHIPRFDMTILRKSHDIFLIFLPWETFNSDYKWLRKLKRINKILVLTCSLYKQCRHSIISKIYQNSFTVNSFFSNTSHIWFKKLQHPAFLIYNTKEAKTTKSNTILKNMNND